MGRTISVELDADLERKFNVVKKGTGLTVDREVIRYLIADRYAKLTRLKTMQIPIKVAEILIDEARRQGVSPGKIVEQIILEKNEKGGGCG